MTRRFFLSFFAMVLLGGSLGIGAGIASAVERDSPYEAEIRAPIGVIFLPGIYGIPGQHCRLFTSDGTTEGTPLTHDADNTQDIECFPEILAFDPLIDPSPLTATYNIGLAALALINWDANFSVVSEVSDRYDVIGPVQAAQARTCHRLNLTGQVYERNSADNHPDAGYVYETCAGRED